MVMQVKGPQLALGWTRPLHPSYLGREDARQRYQGLFFIIVVGIYNLATDRRADLPMDVH